MRYAVGISVTRIVAGGGAGSGCDMGEGIVVGGGAGSGCVCVWGGGSIQCLLG